jgi:uncharacterized protein
MKPFMTTNRTLLALALAPAFVFALSSCSDFSNPAAGLRKPADGRPKATPGNEAGSALPPEFEKPNEGDFTESKMLVNIGTQVVAKGVREFKLQVELFRDRLNAHCEDLSLGDAASGTVAASEKQAREQWQKAMLAFHFIDVAPIGPLSDNSRTLGEQIYSWPFVNLCGIDLEVIRLHETGSVNMQVPFSQKGLAAIEYLLFDTRMTTGCNPRAYPHTVVWAEKPVQAKKNHRCQYAKALAQDLWEKTLTLDRAWAVDQGNFTKALINGTRHKKLAEATNEVTDALFSLENLKDQRLGRPLGRHKDCFSAEKKCPESVEHLWSGLSLEAVTARLNGFKAVFFGSSNPATRAFGLDDYLDSRGHKAVADKILAHLERASGAADSLKMKGDLRQQIQGMSVEMCERSTVTERLEPLCGLHQDIRQISIAMKAEVLAILSLRAPPIFQGDND